MASIEDSIRLAVREEFADLLGLPDECPAMVCIRDQRDVIRDLERRIAELEKRPYIVINEPVQFNPNPIYKYEPDPNSTGHAPTYGNLFTVTCKGNAGAHL